MSTTTAAAQTGAVTDADEPRSWGPEDRPHIRRLERPPYRGPRTDVTSEFVVPLTREQNAWLAAEQQRTGLGAVQVLQGLVEEARLRSEGAEAPGSSHGDPVNGATAPVLEQ
jgi:hypothetical protein